MATEHDRPDGPKPLTIRLSAEDEARLLAIRAQLPGRSTMADVIRESLKTEAEKRNIIIAG